MIDEARVHFSAGKGGDGAVSFRHEKYVPKGGPDGGDGGDGGNIILVSSDDLHGLSDFRFKKQFNAEDGQRGGKQQKKGKNGQDMVLKVPVGTLLKTTDDKVLFDFDKKGLRFILCRGGQGGRGNTTFKSSTNTTPRQFTPGLLGEQKEVLLDLEVIADVGLIGFPNAGKSSLISKITSARPKVGNYPFTTLEPVMGVMTCKGKKITLADMPGIIEGASKGKGLGEKFLKHIARTKVIVYVIDINNDDIKSYFDILRNELMQYSEKLIEKKFLIVLTKSDLVSSDLINKRLSKLSKVEAEAMTVSAESGANIENLKEKIANLVG